MNTRFKLAAAVVLAVAASFSHAGIIEDLLAKPAIQSLLGRVPELQVIVQKCTDARYRQRNPAICQQSDEASRLARIPLELRAVLATPAAAASIRELCLGAQTTVARNTYLCTELGKADLGFAALAEERRNAAAAAQEGPQLGK